MQSIDETQASLAPPRVHATVPFNRDGVHHGFLKVPHSVDASAWGAVMVPVTVIRNGNGPTALLTAGNHGDEYEGQVALTRLALELSAENVRGRIIVIPHMNMPAVSAGTRTSPLDKGNLNRAFPGRVDGTVTERIADYFTRVLLPMADVVLDLHAGGRTMDCLPFAAIHKLPDPVQQARCEAAMAAFAAPYSICMLEPDNHGLYDTAAEAQGKVFVTTELGGGGTSTAASIAIAYRGVFGVLAWAEIVSPAVYEQTTGGAFARPASTPLDMPDASCYLTSEHTGLIEMCLDLGDDVRRGDVLARVHDVTRTGVRPAVYRAPRDGLLLVRHAPGLIAMGDMLAVIGVRCEPPLAGRRR